MNLTRHAPRPRVCHFLLPLEQAVVVAAASAAAAVVTLAAAVATRAEAAAAATKARLRCVLRSYAGT